MGRWSLDPAFPVIPAFPAWLTRDAGADVARSSRAGGKGVWVGRGERCWVLISFAPAAQVVDVWGVRCGVWGVRCKVWGVGCKVWGVGCRVWGVGFRGWGLSFLA